MISSAVRENTVPIVEAYFNILNLTCSKPEHIFKNTKQKEILISLSGHCKKHFLSDF